jgi:hypothetical protein
MDLVVGDHVVTAVVAQQDDLLTGMVGVQVGEHVVTALVQHGPLWLLVTVMACLGVVGVVQVQRVAAGD